MRSVQDLFDLAVKLIKKGLCYVCFQKKDEIEVIVCVCVYVCVYAIVYHQEGPVLRLLP